MMSASTATFITVITIIILSVAAFLSGAMVLRCLKINLGFTWPRWLEKIYEYACHNLFTTHPPNLLKAISGLPLRMIEWFVGESMLARKKFWSLSTFLVAPLKDIRSVYLALAYWFIVPIISVAMIPVEAGWTVKNSMWSVVALFLSIWPNVIGDWISLRVTKHCIEKYEIISEPTALDISRFIIVDLAVAISALVLVILSTNTGYLVLIYQNIDDIVNHFVDIVLSFDTIFRPFALRMGGEQVGEGSGMMFWVAITTFVPTIVWIASACAVWVLTILSNILNVPLKLVRKLVIEREEQEFNIGLLVSSFGLFLVCISLISKLTD